MLYNAAAFLADGIGKAVSGGKLKSFAEVFPGMDGPQQSKNEDDLLATILALNAQLGGEVYYGNR